MSAVQTVSFPNMIVTSVVPFLGVAGIERSTDSYIDGLGFTMTKKWVDDGKLRWCWLEKGAAALMMQEFWKDGPQCGQPAGKLGQGVSLVLICEDALAIYRDIASCRIHASEPFVENAQATDRHCKVWSF